MHGSLGRLLFSPWNQFGSLLGAASFCVFVKCYETHLAQTLWKPKLNWSDNGIYTNNITNQISPCTLMLTSIGFWCKRTESSENVFWVLFLSIYLSNTEWHYMDRMALHGQDSDNPLPISPLYITQGWLPILRLNDPRIINSSTHRAGYECFFINLYSWLALGWFGYFLPSAP
jgi:hypothetical protein